MDGPHKVVIVGGGFGGLVAARSLGRAAVRVTLLDRRNFHCFQPLLYQVATGGLSPANIAAPLRGVLKRQRNTQVLLAEVVGFDVPGRRVLLSDSDPADGVAERTSVTYDTLVVATGASHNYFGNEHWAALAPGLKTIEDATAIRHRILVAFERAERAAESADVRALLTFVIVGAGPTGVELAGAVSEIARDTLRREFRTINPADARIVLVDAADRVLPGYPPDLSARAAASLARLGVQIRVGACVTQIFPDAVALRAGNEELRVPTHTVLWAAGVQASPLGRTLAAATGAVYDRAGRVVVAPDLTIPGHPELFVIGDLASFSHQTGQPLPGVAPVAMQQGRYVARLIVARLENRTLPPFRYRDYGSLATIGRAAAVADFGKLRFSGYAAWLMWLFIHLMQLVEFQNRVLVLLQWGWNYFTFNRAARLITGDAPRAAAASTVRRSDGPVSAGRP